MSVKDKCEEEIKALFETRTVKGAQSFLGSKSGVLSISLISFLESFLPLPIVTDPFLVAAILVNKANAFKIFIFTTVASVVGGVCAFYTATFFLDVLLSHMSLGVVEQFQSLVDSNSTNTFLLTITGAVTPVPYTLVAWAVAVLEGSLAIFIMASVLGRGIRYALVAYSTYRFGQTAILYARKYISIATILLILIIIAYFWYKM